MSKNLQFSSLLDLYGPILTDKQRKTLEYYYNEDLSLSEISENLCITRQGVHDLIKRAESEIITMEEKLQFFSRSQHLNGKLDNIYEDSEKIYLLSNENEDVKAFAKRIMETVKNILET